MVEVALVATLASAVQPTTARFPLACRTRTANKTTPTAVAARSRTVAISHTLMDARRGSLMVATSTTVHVSSILCLYRGTESRHGIFGRTIGAGSNGGSTTTVSTKGFCKTTALPVTNLWANPSLQ